MAPSDLRATLAELAGFVDGNDAAGLAELGSRWLAAADTLADASAEILRAAGRRLVEGLPSDLAPESVVAILTTAVGAVADGLEGLPLDDDAIDAHLHGLRALEPLPSFDDAEAPPFLELERAPEASIERPSGEMVQLFQVEARDLLSTCETRLLELEAEPGATRGLAELFRALHSFKGNCGFLGFSQLERLAHAAESLLVHVQAGRRALDEAAVSALIYAVDGLTEGVDRATDDAAVPRLDELVGALHRVTPGHDAEEAATVQVASARPVEETPAAPLPTPSPTPSPAPSPTDELAGPEAPSRARSETTLRVDVGKIDQLLDLVGELIIAGTAVRHLPVSGAVEEAFGRASAQLDRVVRSLQDVAMSLRMVPVGPTFQRMTRLVRDVSHKVGKQVDLAIEGEDTEIDKTVAELMVDPLVHLIRNAIDHGLETPEARTSAGKPATGRVRLSASHVGGEVWLRVEDDGRGLDRDRILARAIDRGLVEREAAAQLSEAEVFAFVFEPGFSTAERVTDVSGRGVGMDVVHKNLQRVKGRVDIHSVPGQGAAFTLRIPLTLAIIEGMLVRVGASTFTVPLLSIRESVIVRASEVTVLSTWQEMVRIRGELVPVLRMHRLYGVEPDHHELHEGILVVVEDGGRTLCLFVDELVGQRQTVIKAVSGWLGTLRGIAGCTVLGDGKISLILDVPSLLHHSATA